MTSPRRSRCSCWKNWRRQPTATLTASSFTIPARTAVEAALRCARAATGKIEFVSFWRDFHGKTMGAVSCAGVDKTQGLRAPGFFLAPRPNCYRCPFKMQPRTATATAPIFWSRRSRTKPPARSPASSSSRSRAGAARFVPPDEFMPRLRKLCDKLGCLLIADEVLTCIGPHRQDVRHGALDTIPDITTLGKGFGNAFPGHGHVRQRPLQGKHREDLRLVQLRRQSDGLRRRPGLD